MEEALRAELARYESVMERERIKHRQRMEDILSGRSVSWLEEEENISSSLSLRGCSDECATLNVGGMPFTFHLATLRSDHLKDSFLGTLFSERCVLFAGVEGVGRGALTFGWCRWKRGGPPVFVDRDSRLFAQYIAPYVRGQHAALRFREEDCEALLQETDFFMLDGLAQMVHAKRVQWVWTETPCGALSNGGATLTHVLHGDCISVGSVPLPWGITYVWQVKLESGGNGVLVGVALNSGVISRTASAKNLELRWRLACDSGRVACPGQVRGEVQLAAFSEPLEKDAVVRIKVDGRGGLWFSVNASPWECVSTTLPPGVAVLPYIHLTRINTVISLAK